MYGDRISGEKSGWVEQLVYWPQMDTDAHGCSDSLTERVIGAAFEVSNVLGPGFLEKVYERALLKELALRGIDAKGQAGLQVLYKGQTVGEYIADVLVEGELVVELKCADSISNEHVAQCINYLKASTKRVALLLNFQRPKLQIRRIVN
jgi:GxxExxY protein